MSHEDFETLIGPDRRRWFKPTPLDALIVVVALAVVAGMVALWPRGEILADLDPLGFVDDTAQGEVVSVDVGPCPYAPEDSCSMVVFLVVGGDYAGSEHSQEFPEHPGQPEFRVGDRVHLSVIVTDGGPSFQWADFDRGPLLGALAAAFALFVIALGRFRGVAALFALAISLAILIWFILPAILTGRDAVAVALVGGGAIMLVSLYVAHGYTPMTHAATLGAFGALLLTVALSAAAVTLARFSGLAGDEGLFLVALPGIDLRGLLLAGITLGALGALDDVTVTQASAVWEVHNANPSLGPVELYRSGLRVGRDHIVSTVNTLLLAYAGASLPLLIIFVLSGASLGVVASSEVVAVELVRTLVGSMGLVTAVPLTTWMASRLATRSVRGATRL